MNDFGLVYTNMKISDAHVVMKTFEQIDIKYFPQDVTSIGDQHIAVAYGKITLYIYAEDFQLNLPIDCSRNYCSRSSTFSKIRFLLLNDMIFGGLVVRSQIYYLCLLRLCQFQNCV